MSGTSRPFSSSQRTYRLASRDASKEMLVMRRTASWMAGSRAGSARKLLRPIFTVAVFSFAPSSLAARACLRRYSGHLLLEVLEWSVPPHLQAEKNTNTHISGQTSEDQISEEHRVCYL